MIHFGFLITNKATNAKNYLQEILYHPLKKIVKRSHPQPITPYRKEERTVKKVEKQENPKETPKGKNLP